MKVSELKKLLERFDDVALPYQPVSDNLVVKMAE
jgi:hypothetical protein